jgi:uracil phosphoribosyltransferase
MEQVTVIQNAIALDALTYLRKKETTTEQFRFYSDRLCAILLSYAFAGIALEDRDIETPITNTKGKNIAEHIVILPILRAGLAMLSQALLLMPSAKIGFTGLARDEQTAIAHEYYWKMPEMHVSDRVYIIDPMIATGGSILHVVKKLFECNITHITIVSIIAAPEGIATIHQAYKDVTFFTGAIDETVNDKKYIIPGLGDYGDRYFGTNG